MERGEEVENPRNATFLSVAKSPRNATRANTKSNLKCASLHPQTSYCASLEMKANWINCAALAATFTIVTAFSRDVHHHAEHHLHYARQSTNETGPACPASNGTQYETSNSESFIIECGFDRPGVNINSTQTATFGECIDWCGTTPTCELVSTASMCRQGGVNMLM